MDARAAAPPLGYAPPVAWHRRRRSRLVATALLLVALVVGGTFAWKRYGPWLQTRTAMLSAQRECLNFTPAPDSVVFQQDGGVTYASNPWSFAAAQKPNVPLVWEG